MGLDPTLTKMFPRDFKNIPVGTEYGAGADKKLNEEAESRRMDYLEKELMTAMKQVVETKERPMFTTALITGDCVILDAIHKAGLLSKIPIVFVDTYTLFPETLAFLKEVENHYGFKAKIYAAEGCKDQEDYYNKYGRDYWMKDIDAYDKLCKVEPMNRALKEQNSTCLNIMKDFVFISKTLRHLTKAMAGSTADEEITAQSVLLFRSGRVRR